MGRGVRDWALGGGVSDACCEWNTGSSDTNREYNLLTQASCLLLNVQTSGQEVWDSNLVSSGYCTLDSKQKKTYTIRDRQKGHSIFERPIYFTRTTELRQINKTYIWPDFRSWTLIC